MAEVSNWGGGGGGDDDDWEREPWKKFQKDNEKKVYNKEKRALNEEDEHEYSDKFLGNYHGFKVYIEDHQGKHCNSAWPGFKATGKQGPWFLDAMITYNNPALFHILCSTSEFRDAISAQGADGQNGLMFFNFGKIVCGTAKQTSCQLQWKRKGDTILIHGCPDPKGLTMGTFVDIKNLKR